jgi:hypothetical protein
LNALKVDAGIILQFTKVLDIYQEVGPEIEPPGDPVNRAFWDKRASESSMAVLDQLVAMIEQKIAPARVTYNKNHIAIGTTGTNFCWVHPPKEAPHLHVRVRTGEEGRDNVVQKLSDALPYVRPFQSDTITIKLSTKDLKENTDLVEKLLVDCEAHSRSP